MITISYEKSSFDGDIVIRREFYDPKTGNYLQIEAHEIGESNGESNRFNPFFNVAFWSMGDNLGGQGCDGNLHHVVKSMQEYIPDPGLIEMPIPEDAWC